VPRASYKSPSANCACRYASLNGAPSNPASVAVQAGFVAIYSLGNKPSCTMFSIQDFCTLVR